MSDLPVLGVAMTLDDFETHRDLMLDRQRDVELQDFWSAEVLNGDWKSLAERAKTVLDGHTGRRGIHGPFWGFTIASEDYEIRDIVRKRLLQGLDVCDAIGATQMVIHSPVSTWTHYNIHNYPDVEGYITDLTHKTLTDVVRRAEETGVVLVIENIEDMDPHMRVRLADSFDSEAVAVSLDTGHANYAHGAHVAPPVDYFVTAAGNRLQHVHLQDTEGYADRHWAIGEGCIPWPAVFQALSKLDSNPRLNIEIKDKSKIPASIRYLNDLGLAQ